MDDPSNPYATHKTLGRIEATVDLIKDDIEELKDLLLEQNGRVRSLEIESGRSQGGWKVAGIVGMFAGTLGSIGAKFFGG